MNSFYLYWLLTAVLTCQLSTGPCTGYATSDNVLNPALEPAPELRFIKYVPSWLEPENNTPLGGPSFRGRRQGYRNMPYSKSGCTLNIEATPRVSSTAHRRAYSIISRMCQNMPSSIFCSLARRAKVGIFTRSEKTTIFSEYAAYRDRPQCSGRCSGSCKITCTGDGRKYDSLAGVGGVRATCVDDNILCNSRDTYRSTFNVLVHEFAHTVHGISLPSYLKNQIRQAYTKARNARTWTYGSYAMSTEQEYFAEGGSCFFNTNKHTVSAGGMNMCGGSVCRSEDANRRLLYSKDNGLFNVLSYVFTSHKPWSTYVNIKTCP